MSRIHSWTDFNDYIGEEMYSLIEAMPKCFDRLVLDSGRQVWAHIYTGEKVEIQHDGFGIITKIRRKEA